MKSETFPTVSDVLKRARQLLSRGWCQNSLGITGGGLATGWQDREAVQFCALGAMCRAYHDLGLTNWGAGRDALERVREVVGMNVVEWNNAPERTREEVLAAFDQAAGGK